MKKNIALLLSTAGLLHAGPETGPVAMPKAEPWIKPTIDARARYEFAQIDGFDSSNELSVRERVGLKTAKWNGFSALVEGEFSQAIVDDYNGGAPGADPFDPANSLIPDPETNELNQLYVQYDGFDTMVRLGRQRIIYDNAAFVGNVGWRQNEQTYDALSITNKSIAGLTLNYSYINQVNRVFGSDADAPLGPPPAINVQDVAADVHLFNASYTGIQGVTLGGYVYLMNFEDLPAWDNQTYGVSAKGDVAGITLYGELAWQNDASTSGGDDAMYAHLTATKAFGPQSLTLGVEHLAQGFKTPLATLHAFNGFADVTDAARGIGSHNGLTDLYLTHTMPIFFGIKWMNAIHAFGDNEISTGYGWEIDSVLTKKFDDNFTAIAKLAHFESEGDIYAGKGPLPDATRLSVELDYTF